MKNTDSIEKQILFRAPLEKVWRALTDSRQFGTWFRCELEGPFEPGSWTYGRITHPEYMHLKMALLIEKLEPQRFFSYRWHPFAVDPNVDYSLEPTTLVEFRLEEHPEGTQLFTRESGFDQLPAARRAEAYPMNDHGWTEQLHNIERYLQAQT